MRQSDEGGGGPPAVCLTCELPTHNMQGLHITADLSGCSCSPSLLTDALLLRQACEVAVAQSGLSPVNALFHSFAPGSGVTGVVLLAESHLAVHTWPELGCVTLDVYVCNFGQDNSPKARELAEQLQAVFAPSQTVRQELQRGLNGTHRLGT